MQIPPYRWRLLSQKDRRRIYCLIRLLCLFNDFYYPFKQIQTLIASSFSALWNSQLPIFVASFTAVIAFPLLVIMPLHPMSIPTSFGAGLSISVIMRSIKTF